MIISIGIHHLFLTSVSFAVLLLSVSTRFGAFQQNWKAATFQVWTERMALLVVCAAVQVHRAYCNPLALPLSRMHPFPPQALSTSRHATGVLSAATVPFSCPDPMTFHLELQANHTKMVPYSSSTDNDVWDYLKLLDADPVNRSNVRLFYNCKSIFPGRRGEEWVKGQRGQGWEREHLWPKHRGKYGLTDKPGSDLHALRAAQGTCNVVHKDYKWGVVEEPDGKRCPLIKCGVDATFNERECEPGDEIKGVPTPAIMRAGSVACGLTSVQSFCVPGEIARAMMYMDMMYFYGQSDVSMLSISNDPYIFVDWNERFPPTAAEKSRSIEVMHIQVRQTSSQLAPGAPVPPP